MFWGCSEGVLGVFWGSSGGVLGGSGEFLRTYGGVLGGFGWGVLRVCSGGVLMGVQGVFKVGFKLNL